MKRLQGAEYHAIKGKLIPIAYSKTKHGNVCMYYKGGYKHYLNDEEKNSISYELLKERYKNEV